MAEEIKKKRKYTKRKKVVDPTKPMRGGAREGAGRPPQGGEKNISFGIRIKESSYRRYKVLKERGMNPSETIEKAIDNLAQIFGIE